MILSSVESKLLRLMLDPQAHSGEAEACRAKLISSLAKRGLNAHDIVESNQTGSDQQFQNDQPLKMSRPDYGLCKMPFGPNKGRRFMDLAPHDLRFAMRWAMKTPQLAQKFADFIHDAGAFLDIQNS
jgi:hypothetical protein